MQNEKRLRQIERLLKTVRPLEGDVVEIGCYLGDTSKFLANLVHPKRIHVFDAFQGLPKPTAEDVANPTRHEGVIKVSLDDFKSNWDQNLLFPHVHVGWIADTGHEIPNKVKFALIDVDLYLGTKQSLELLYDKLVPGGVVVLDDYNHFVFGSSVQKATKEFLADKPETLVAENSECIYSGRECDNAWFRKVSNENANVYGS